MSEPQEMVKLVRGRTLDCRTGLLLLPLEQLGQEVALAARLNVDAADFVKLKAATLRPNARFMRLERDTLIADLDALCSGESVFGVGNTDCFLVYNFDLALSFLGRLERLEVWSYLRDRFRQRARGMVFSLPETATDLLPSDSERDGWHQGGRLSHFRGSGLTDASHNMPVSSREL